MMSYDVKALLTSVPTQPATNIIRKLLEQDQELQHRTPMTVDNIICLLEFYLNSTYFMFQGKYYEQLEGAAMGSPISPIVANLCMGNFVVEAIRSAPHPPQLWKRFVDDTFTIIQSSQKWIHGIHQLYRWTHSNYMWRPKGRWIHAFSRYIDYTWRGWKPQHHCIQEAYTYWPVSAMEQSSYLNIQIQCDWHPAP